MSHRLSRALCAAVLAAFAIPSLAAADPVPGAYIVTLTSGDPDAAAQNAKQKHGASVDHVYRSALRGYAAHMSSRSAAEVAQEPDVATVVQDQTVSIEASAKAKPGGGGGGGTPETTPTGIRRIDSARSSATTRANSASVNVAVIDTGIDLTHPDLNVSSQGVNCSSGTSFADGNGHGTHVAGTIGAKANGIGVVGVAPGAKVWPVRVLNNQGSGSWSSIICGIDWVTARAATIRVANMSLGGTGTPGSCTDGGLRQAICRSTAAGVTYAVAAGNETDDASNHVPANFPEVITVSALADFDGAPGGTGAPTCRTDKDDTFADFSNFGAPVDVIAPGVCIQSTWKGGGYNTISGTSMATPHVAGAAALWLAGHPSATPADIRGAVTKGGGVWDTTTDPDPWKDPLLTVAGF